MDIQFSESRLTALHALISKGRYATLDSAMDAAIEALLEREATTDEWWRGVIRQCEHADQNPADLLDSAEMFQSLRDEFAAVSPK